jgi:uncharacterized membrane protein YhaH (DUF805 family)
VANAQTGARRSSIAWLLLSLRGRASRQTYWLSYLMLVCLNAVIVGQLLGGEEASFGEIAAAVGPVVIIATIYSNLAVTVKRLHDVGYSGFLSVAMFVPLVNFFFTIWVGILPGTAGPNPYGDVPDSVPA